MSRLFVVRHGQASFGESDYDRLSPLGESQSRRYGEYWAERRAKFDRVFVGPRRRHWQTHDLAAAAYQERGLNWPVPIELPGLDEYCGLDVMARSLPGLIEEGIVVEEMLATPAAFGKVFKRVTRSWVRGEVEMPGLESWQDFRVRVGAALERMTRGVEAGQRIVAFTSAGAVAATTACALDLSDERTLELSWIVLNTGHAEFRLLDGRLDLMAFNPIPHLTSPDHVSDL